jgi:predicted methyltransferase MtxX (methanogen marker protein 4)
MKDTNPVWYVVIALTIWCITNSVARNNFVKTLSGIQQQQEVMVVEFSDLSNKLEELKNIEPKVIVKEVIKEIPAEIKGVIDVK